MSVMELINKKSYYEDLLWEMNNTYETLKKNQELIESNDLVTINLIKALENSISSVTDKLNELNGKLQTIVI